jgi:DNA polymerase (family 10)
MKSRKQNIALARAESVAASLRHAIAPHCERFQIAGSTRRRCSVVHDLDVVVIPKVGGSVGIYRWAKESSSLISAGQTRIQIIYLGIPVDIYLADPDTWTTLLLIRTGSAQHNIKLCSTAKKLGYCLHSDGRGLFTRTGEKIKTDSEKEFFERLGLPYKPPEERSN